MSVTQINWKNSKKAACDNEVVFVDMQPPNNDYWADTETWEYRIECKTAFEWFIGNETHYIKKLQNYVRDWKQEHTLRNHKIDVLNEKFYFLEQCEVGELSGDVVIICKNSTIHKMQGNSKIISMHGCSYVDEMSGNSSITIAMDKCCVHRMCNTTQIQLFFVKHFSLKRASEFPVFVKGISLLSAGHSYASRRMRACSIR